MLLAVLLGVAGCTTTAPDTAYRRELEKAISAGSCEPRALENMWAAYHQWYAVSSSLADYHQFYEAEALLRQGEMFSILGCRDVARASYDMLLKRFPGPDHRSARERAAAALTDLNPPPMPLQPNPTAVRSL
jgi:hypothetical protein